MNFNFIDINILKTEEASYSNSIYKQSGMRFLGIIFRGKFYMTFWRVGLGRRVKEGNVMLLCDKIVLPVALDT